MSNLPELPALPYVLKGWLSDQQKAMLGDYVRSYAEEAVKQEREACAKLCEAQADRFMQGSPMEGNKPYAAMECSAAIRSRALQQGG